MAVLRTIADRILNGEITSLEEAVNLYGSAVFQEAATNGLLKERIAELELAIEDSGWWSLTNGVEGTTEFSRDGLRAISRNCRLYWLKNPLIKRAVYTQASYVFGQGMTVKAAQDDVQAVVDAFMDDPKNQAELTTQEARTTKECELQVDGNLFFVFFVNDSTGQVRVRSIPFEQVAEVIKNPEDSKEPWYYHRVWYEPKAPGEPPTELREMMYPDFRYNPKGGYEKEVKSIPVAEEQVYHVKVNCLSDMTFGVSEVYAAIDWAKSYREFLEDWATIVRSLSRFAWKATSKVGPKGVSLAKDKLNSTFDPSTETSETKLPPNAGSVFLSTEGVQLDAITKSGTTTSVEDGRRLLLMVSAATGIFEHYFGDPSTGNLATATAMERPMELMFRDRQELWAGVFRNVLEYVIDQSIIAPNGELSGTVEFNDYDERVVLLEAVNPARVKPGSDTTATTEEDKPDKSVNVEFPPILEKDPAGRVDAIVKAATLAGQQPAGTIPDIETLAKMLLTALGEADVQELVDEMFDEEAVAEREQEELRKKEQNMELQAKSAKMMADANPEQQFAPKQPGAPKPPPGNQKASEALVSIAGELESAMSELAYRVMEVAGEDD